MRTTLVPAETDALAIVRLVQSPPNSSVTVGELLFAVRNALEREIPLQWVTGEISGFKRASSGHCYFDLKDANAQIACALYRNRAALVGFELRDGAQVELRVRPTIYEPRGSLQFSVEQARLAGIGQLYEAFMRLKAKLEFEGLFDPSKKRALPPIPQRIGLITSKQAAALADMLRVLRDRWPRATVIVYPASVQGVNAPGELLRALSAANARRECDVLVIGRGGGSLEDLWAFNDESLVRAVAKSAIPIVSAVGHETDFTLCDFAADVRAPTPTAAAALIVPERRALFSQIDQIAVRSRRAFERIRETLDQRLDRAHDRLRSSDRALAAWRTRVIAAGHRLERAISAVPQARRARMDGIHLRFKLALRGREGLSESRLRLDSAATRAASAIAQRIQRQQLRFDRLEQALMHLNPQNVLDRGYAVLFDLRGREITDASQLTQGALFSAQVKHGIVDAQVIATRVDADQKPAA
ncbi:MAG: exodeoxyribonuclease VII large subunit [Burkholderiales bacterium]|nr:MAG: exodeoxyribonuclease VII large subunit [Burkholderiales bacterium]